MARRPQKLEAYEPVDLKIARELRDQFLRDWPEWQELVRKMKEIEDGDEESARQV